MRISKKLYTTLIITVLTISAVMAAIPMASAEIVGNPFLVATYPPGSTAPLTVGPPGTQVDVVGNATGGAADPFATVKVYWKGLSGPVLGTGDANNLGEYRIRITVPLAINGTHWIVVNDGETESGGAAFQVIPSLSVKSIPPAPYGPTLALPGDGLTVTGHGFAPNDQITLFLNQTTNPAINYVITAPTFTTNASGSFSGQITVPAMPITNFDWYVFNATDEDGNSAVYSVSIDYYITVGPPSGPTGISIFIFGRIAANFAYEIRFNGAPIAAGTTDSTGSYFQVYTIPAVLSPAVYPVDIWWNTTQFRNTTFQVTPQPTITLGATSGIAGNVVSISGQDFVGGASITLYFGTTVVNSTDMDARFGPTSYYPAGVFSENFVVPTLTPGIYTVKVVDSYGATSAPGVFFTIYPTPLITLETRATEYYQGDLMSLYTWSNVIPSYDVAWEIADPTGNLYVYGYIYTSDWYMVSVNNYMVPYYRVRLSTYWNNMIPDDAPIGVWNFTAYNSGTSAKIDTNLFSVSAKPTMTTVLEALAANTTAVIDEIDECCSNMSALLAALDAKITAIDGAVATVSTKVGDMNVALTALDAKITGIATASSVSSLDSKVSGLASDIITIKTSIGGFTTSLASLDAVLGVVAGDTAVIRTSIGTINGTITDMDGTIATIQTDIGTLKVDVAALKTDVASVQSDVEESLPVTVDMMPVWIAVVLSLIAAIAAIFAVVTIRQKIAG